MLRRRVALFRSTSARLFPAWVAGCGELHRTTGKRGSRCWPRPEAARMKARSSSTRSAGRPGTRVRATNTVLRAGGAPRDTPLNLHSANHRIAGGWVGRARRRRLTLWSAWRGCGWRGGTCSRTDTFRPSIRSASRCAAAIRPPRTSCPRREHCGSSSDPCW